MQFITTITQKGQITIPKKIREAVNLKVRDRVRITLEKGEIRVQKFPDILDLAGKFKPKVKVNALKAREELEKNFKRL